MTSKIIYVGDFRTESVHLQSGTKILSDAPTDNHGKGEAFSPTDLVANSLATCILTTMAIKASAINIDLKGSTADVTKEMANEPRRIAKITVNIEVTGTDDAKSRTILERVGYHCPVAASLNPDLVQDITFNWK
jgi:uncharacterized OsmC-like protein